MNTVSELLDRKGTSVAVIGKTATIASALGLLAKYNIGALVVSDNGIEVQGILSERDIVRALNRLGPAVLAEPVQTAMSSPVRTCSVDDSVESLMTVMTEHRIRHLPVVSKGALAGIVSIGDVVKTRIDELEDDRDALVEYIYAR